ncbi:MAG: adenylate/guanylate cyclase domain-containing protein [Longimicrobiales bacterium]
MQSTTRFTVSRAFRTLGPQHPRRVPAAIMFADIAGYSAMMQADEAAALEARGAYRRALAEAVKDSGGVVVQHYGDGSLSIFTSAAAASAAALAMQRQLLAEPKVLVRIGLHSDCITRDTEGVYGHGINLASRIQSLCPPGAVLMSDPVAQELREASAADCKPMGLYQFKNIKDPVGVHALVDPRVVCPVPHRLHSTSAYQVAPPLYPRLGEVVEKGALARLAWEFKRRRVDRVALGYGAAAIALVLGLKLAVGLVGIPDAVWRSAGTALVAGFPIAIVLAWVFDLAPGWLVMTQRLKATDS